MPPVDNAMLQGHRVIARDYRNSRLGDFLKELKLTEGRGTGLPKIRRFMALNGPAPAIFTTNEMCDYYLTTLPIHPQFLVGETAKPTQSPTQSSAPIITVSEQIIIVVNALKDGPKSTHELMTILGLKHRNTFKLNYLQPALNHGIIAQRLPNKPNSRLQKYCLTTQGQNVVEQAK